MRMIDIIEKKKYGNRLTKQELAYIANGAGDGSIPDYQLAAWLMAVWFKGMTEQETAQFTLAMRDSGAVADLSVIKGVKVDKHSTGGVGDKTTLIVAPIAASCGLKIAKMSGRGLGHTGGTIDKLESIKGLSTSISSEKFAEIVNQNGMCVIGQSKGLVPADKHLYALRDVTGTVDCMPLIASSIMSKKLAGGADIIILDVKYGSGSFMSTRKKAEELAKLMVGIGTAAEKKVSAVITDMDTPLGHNVGNLLEVAEAVEMLKGGGDSDLREVCHTLVKQMLHHAGYSDTEADNAIRKSIESGSALQKLADTVRLQGGDSSWILDTDKMPKAKYQQTVTAEKDGYIRKTDTKLIGEAAMLLGAGRAVLEDQIDPCAGLTILKKTGDKVQRGESLAVLYASYEAKFESAKTAFLSAFQYGDTSPKPIPLIYKIIS